MLKLKNVSKYYYKNGVIAAGITKVNLELHIGEFVVITGESGSGKSTLLNVLSGLDTYEDGEMYINGEETSHYTEEDFLEYRRKYVSNIFQNFNLVNSYSVYENIELAMLMNGKNRKDVKNEVNELIEKVGLKKYRNTKTSKLSGGQKQRVAIARALANDTPIIVADEPTGALDSKSAKEILELLYKISQDKLVIVVTHNKKEIEEYATRLLRMHDGKLLENRLIKKIDLDSEATPKEVKSITGISKTRLGIRNTFNIPVKFILMFIIFSLISLTLLSNYAVFKEAENTESITSYSSYFIDSSDKRIIVTKKDKSAFNVNDINKIKEIDGINKVIEHDLLNDYNISLNNDYIYLSGKLLNGIYEVDVGRKPVNDNEVVIKGSPDSYYLSDLQDELFNKSFTLDGDTTYEKIKIVGIIYDYNTYDDYMFEFAFSNNVYNMLLLSAYERTSSTRVILNNNYFNGRKDNYYFQIVMSDKVPRNEAYIRDSASIYCKDDQCLNNTVSIHASNIYFNDTLNLKITNVINKNNASELLDVKYNNYGDVIFVNPLDLNKLYNKGDYQISVYASEIKDVKSIGDEIEKLGFNTLRLRDAKSDNNQTIIQVFRIIRLVVIIILCITMFFITYFIIKIIYKSRNSYYTTLRTLGCTKKVCVNILMRELISIATISYTVLLIIVYLVANNIIKYDYIKHLTIYVGIRDYIIVYIILLILSLLMTHRYGRKIFKESIIKTYGGEE